MNTRKAFEKIIEPKTLRVLLDFHRATPAERTDSEIDDAGLGSTCRDLVESLLRTSLLQEEQLAGFHSHFVAHFASSTSLREGTSLTDESDDVRSVRKDKRGSRPSSGSESGQKQHKGRKGKAQGEGNVNRL